MCFATAVTDPEGAANYLAKYMRKTFTSGAPRKNRRYTTSRDWPGGEKLQLAVTKEGGWSHIRQWGQDRFNSLENLNPREEDLLKRVGDDITMAISLRKEKRRAIREYKEMFG